MADISLIDPYSAQQESIARQRRMAQALQQQAQAPMEMPQTPGVLISPYAGLAKVLQGAYGGYQEAEADKEYRNLVNEARTNQAEDFAKVIGALKAPGQEAIAGQEASDFVPASYTPEQVSTANYARTVIPEEFTPAIRSKPAIAPQDAREAGYIGPDLIASLKDPAMRQFAMAQAMAKLEPKAPISVAPGGTLLDPRSYKPLFTANAAPQRPVALSPGQELRGPTGNLLATAAEKATSTTPHWEATTQQVGGKPVAGWINLNAADKAASFVAGAKPTEAKAATPHWVEGQKDVNGTTQFGWYDLNAADKDASFKAGANPPAGEKSNWKEVTRDGKVFYEDFNIADATQRQAKARVKEIAKIDQIQLEVEDETGAKKTILVNKDDPRLAAGIATKGADTVMITEVNDKGQTAVRYVKKGDSILTTGYVKPLDGFLGQLQQAGVPMDRIQSDPKIRDLVDRYFVKTAGGVAPEEAAGFELRKAEVVARLGELGIAVPANIKGLSLSATPGVLGGAQLSNAAPAAANGTKAAPLPLPSKTSDYKTGQYYLTNKGVLLFNGSKFVD